MPENGGTRLKKLIKRLKSVARGSAQIIPDVLAISGAVSIGYGAFLINPIAGWIATGVLLIAAAVIWSKGGGVL